MVRIDSGYAAILALLFGFCMPSADDSSMFEQLGMSRTDPVEYPSYHFKSWSLNDCSTCFWQLQVLPLIDLFCILTLIPLHMLHTPSCFAITIRHAAWVFAAVVHLKALPAVCHNLHLVRAFRVPPSSLGFEGNPTLTIIRTAEFFQDGTQKWQHLGLYLPKGLSAC